MIAAATGRALLLRCRIGTIRRATRDVHAHAGTFDLAACRAEVSSVHSAWAQPGTARYDEAAADWSWLDRELSSNVAGETGAVCIYDGARAALRIRAIVLPDSLAPAVATFEFVESHREAEAAHLALFEELLAPAKYTRLLPAWRAAGFLLGFLPALASDRQLFLTVNAVESFVEIHYSEQIAALEASNVAAPETLALLRYCVRGRPCHALRLCTVGFGAALGAATAQPAPRAALAIGPRSRCVWRSLPPAASVRAAAERRRVPVHFASRHARPPPRAAQCADEVHHKEDAARRAGDGELSRLETLWMAVVRVGSTIAADVARRI